jgi:hypothetical protein
MALKRMLLIPPELWEKCSQPPPKPPPVKQILKGKDHSFDKWTKIRIHQDPYLKSQNVKREPIPIPIVETGGTPETKPKFKTKSKRKRVISSAPVFNTEPIQTETETETDDGSPAPSRYIAGILRSKSFNSPTFGVYQDENGSFKIGRSTFKYNDKHVYVDGKRYKATQGLWELLTKSRPEKSTVTHQDKQAYKQILLQSNAHRVNYSPTGRVRANKGTKYTRFISPLFNDTDKREIAWETLQ